MSELLRFFKDMRDNGYGLAEIAAQLGTSAIAEPVAGFAAMYDPVHGADAIREGMTYAPRTQAAQEYSQSVGNAANAAIKPAMPIIDAWKQGVDIAGRYSPAAGAMLRTVPTAIGIAMGAMGSDAAIEAADVVLMTDEPSKIAAVMKIARKTIRIANQNIVFALGVKFLVLILGALGYANMWAAVFADVGVSIIAILNAIRAMRVKLPDMPAGSTNQG